MINLFQKFSIGNSKHQFFFDNKLARMYRYYGQQQNTDHNHHHYDDDDDDN